MDSESSRCVAESEDPEPSPEPPSCSPPRGVHVDILWDEDLATWRSRLGLTAHQITRAVVAAAAECGFDAGQIGVRLTDDRSIHEINLRHLSHDYPTDVISFPYSDDSHRIEGELVASVETAASNAADAGWDIANELLLYIIHGVLHIGGMDDHDPTDRQAMRGAEQAVLNRLGIQPAPATETRQSE